MYIKDNKLIAARLKTQLIKRCEQSMLYARMKANALSVALLVCFPVISPLSLLTLCNHGKDSINVSILFLFRCR